MGTNIVFSLDIFEGCVLLPKMFPALFSADVRVPCSLVTIHALGILLLRPYLTLIFNLECNLEPFPVRGLNRTKASDLRFYK